MMNLLWQLLIRLMNNVLLLIWYKSMWKFYVYGLLSMVHNDHDLYFLVMNNDYLWLRDDFDLVVWYGLCNFWFVRYVDLSILLYRRFTWFWSCCFMCIAQVSWLYMIMIKFAWVVECDSVSWGCDLWLLFSCWMWFDTLRLWLWLLFVFFFRIVGAFHMEGIKNPLKKKFIGV